MGDIIQRIHVRAKCPVVYQAFADASMLREWFCDFAFTQPHDKGRYWMRWDEGRRVEGNYLRVIENRSLAFTWRPLQAPGQTTVKLSFYEAGPQTEVTVAHSGFANNAEWEAFSQLCGQRWQVGLENLKSVLETGVDLRRARRPYLGIRWRLLGDEGLQVLQVMERYGAQPSGLAQGDVIQYIGERGIHGYGDLVAALEACCVGEEITIGVRRDAERCVIPVLLGAMTRTENTLPPENMVARMRDQQLNMQRLLAEALEGVSALEAGNRLDDDHWSVLDILAHLCATERDLHHRMGQIVMRAWDDTPKGDPAMLPEVLTAIQARCDTVPKLLERFQRDQAETLAFMRSLRPEIQMDKARYRRLSESLDLSEHTRQHIDEIAETVRQVRVAMHERQQALERIAQGQQGGPVEAEPRSWAEPSRFINMGGKDKHEQ